MTWGVARPGLAAVARRRLNEGLGVTAGLARTETEHSVGAQHLYGVLDVDNETTPVRDSLRKADMKPAQEAIGRRALLTVEVGGSAREEDHRVLIVRSRDRRNKSVRKYVLRKNRTPPARWHSFGDLNAVFEITNRDPRSGSERPDPGFQWDWRWRLSRCTSVENPVVGRGHGMSLVTPNVRVKPRRAAGRLGRAAENVKARLRGQAGLPWGVGA